MSKKQHSKTSQVKYPKIHKLRSVKIHAPIKRLAQKLPEWELPRIVYFTITPFQIYAKFPAITAL